MWHRLLSRFASLASLPVTSRHLDFTACSADTQSMTIKAKLRRLWQGDPEPELDPYNAAEEDTARPLSRRDLNKIADSYGDNVSDARPRVPPISIGPL